MANGLVIQSDIGFVISEINFLATVWVHFKI